ncbi:Cytoplasmic and mitochondrial histidine tRNA synthetase, partial [Coemansia aciculifera]
RTFWPFVVLVWLATLCYGGGVGVIAATLADMFGASNMSGCHGVILTGWSVAAIGGGLTYTGVVSLLTKHRGYTLSDPFVYVLNQYWILSLLICGWIALLFIRITPRERMFPRVHGEIFHHTFAGVMFRLARGTRQNGLHDYAFLSAAPGLNIDNSGDAGDNEADLESIDSKSEKMVDVNLNPHTTSISSTTDVNALPAIHDSATVSTYRQEDALVGTKQPFASEAFNYVAQDTASIHSAVDTRISCVQLMCAMPPARRCLKLFGKWRLELVSSAEVTTRRGHRSIAAGGRYNELVGMFSSAMHAKGKNTDVSCVGISFGVERIFSIVKVRKSEAEIKANRTQVCVISPGDTIEDSLLEDRMRIAAELWDAGISAEFAYKIKPHKQAQFDTCDSAIIPWAVIIGKDKLSQGNAKIKNMAQNVEEEKGGVTVSRSDMIAKLKQRLQIN